MDILSTRSVAEMLGVSEATVKRWSDAGTLKCFRTPGGHRKFRLRDVKAFLADHDDPSGDVLTPVAPPSTDLSTEQRDARALALSGDVDGLVSLIANQRLKGLTLAQAFDGIITPAMADIGEGWAQGRLSPAQEHVASNTVKDMVARVRPLVERSAREGRGKALCACLGNEQHDIGVRMAGLILTAEGYKTAMAGGNTPAGDLALLIAGDPPSLVALSASPHADVEGLAADLAVVATAASAVKARLIVGGQGFSRLESLPSTVRRFETLEDLVRMTLSS